MVQNRIDMCCPNVVSFPRAIKVPVVLAELDLQICIDVDITLEQPALEIKRVKKDVSLEQCHLVPTSFENHFKLFISGFVRKNIEYASARPVNANANAVCGSILHTTAHVPFSCCTEIKIEGVNFPEFLISSDSEARFIDKSGMRPKIDEKLLSESVHYNELPFCELVDFEINEFDFAKLNTSTPLPQLTNEHIFTTVQEQIVLDLQVKVLQLQQIPIPGKHDHKEECEKNWEISHDNECCCHHEHKCKKKRKKKCEFEDECEKKWDCDHDDDDEEEDEEECCNHGHEKKCKKKRKKKYEYEVEYEEKWDCDHDDDDDDDECCDHGHKKKCKKKRKKKCEHDHDEDECRIHGFENEKKSKKKCKIKFNFNHEKKKERKRDPKLQKKYKKNAIGKRIKKFREKRRRDF